MNAHRLQLYHPSSQATVDGEAVDQKIVTADSSDDTSFAWADLSGVNWAYALGWFDMDTLTPTLRGAFFSIRLATASLITINHPLPANPSTGDTFKLVQGLRFRTSQAIPFVYLNSYVPELTTVSLRQITGVTVKRVHSAVDLYVRYDTESETLSLSADGVNWCSALVVGGGDVTDGDLQTVTGEWMLVDVDVSRLPSATTEERVMISPLWGTLLPPVWVDSDNEDSVLHHFAILKNDSGDSDDEENITVQSITEPGSAVIESLYTDGDSTIELDDVVGLPGRDFWLYLNESEPDLRFVTRRAGNTCYLADTSDWQEVAFDAGSNEPTIGETIEAGSVFGVLRAVYLTGGSWVGNDAVGKMIVSGTDGVFGDGESLVQDSVTIATMDGEGDTAIRGVSRLSSWPVGGSVQAYPPYDVLIILPDSTDEFNLVEGPESVLEYSSVFAPWSASSIGYEAETVLVFGPGDVAALAFRRYLLADALGSLEITEDLSLDWSV